MPRGLRLAVFARRDWMRDNERITIDDGWWPATAVDALTRGKGGVAICIHVGSVGRICFLNCHLPFDAASVAQSNETRVLNGVSVCLLSVSPLGEWKLTFPQVQARSLKSLLHNVQRSLHPHYLVVGSYSTIRGKWI